MTFAEIAKKFPVNSRVRVLPAGAFAVSYTGVSKEAKRLVGKIGTVYSNDGSLITVRFGGPLDPEIIFHQHEIIPYRKSTPTLCDGCKLDLDLCECPIFDNEGNEL